MDSSASNPRSGPATSQALPRAYAARSERERLLEAMVRVAAAKGYETTTVADVVEAAAVSRETFDAMFISREVCFLEAYDAVINVLVAHVSTAFESTVGQPWPDRIVAGLRALVDLLATEHDIARMAMVEVTAVGEDARIRYRAALGRFTYFLEEGRSASPQGDELPADTARFAIGGATSMIFDEIRAGRGPELRRLLPDLLFAVLMPYIGPEAAEDEMRRVSRAA
ncbi:MAG TPA: TetR family transcriptional regulator [Solirubrobacterales bacterium]|jgi:AcrR family transcriptional regulator|nr:TetR family transcriptional regulator [Solirubrobacterales bacterium]